MTERPMMFRPDVLKTLHLDEDYLASVMGPMLKAKKVDDSPPVIQSMTCANFLSAFMFDEMQRYTPEEEKRATVLRLIGLSIRNYCNLLPQYNLTLPDIVKQLNHMSKDAN